MKRRRAGFLTQNRIGHIRSLRVLAAALWTTGFTGHRLAAQDLDPRLAGHWSFDSRVVNAIVVQEGLLYAAVSQQSQSDSPGRLRVIDLTDRTDPRKVGRFDLNYGTASDVAVSGHHVCLVTESWEHDLRRIEVIDVSDWTEPLWGGGWETAGRPADIAISRGCAFVAETFADEGLQLKVIEIGDPANPRQLESYQLSNHASYTCQIGISSNYAYVATSPGPFSADLDDESWMEVFDISDPSQLHFVDRHDATALAYDVAVLDDWAYVVDSPVYFDDSEAPSSGGVAAIDVSDRTPSTSSEAQCYLDEAKATFERIQNGNPDGLGRDWHEMAVFELLLREAEAHWHRVYAGSSPRQSQGGQSRKPGIDKVLSHG